jgi:hypothetical protein
MSIHQKLRAFALVSAAALMLGGCSAAAAPEAEPSASPSASVGAEPATVAALQFSGSDVQSLDADQNALESVGFSEGSAAVVDFVSTVLDVEPTVTEEEAQCAGAHTRYAWEGITVTQWADTPEFLVGFDVSSIGAVRIETTGGFAVGDDVSAFIATVPADNVGRPGGDDVVVGFDVVNTVTEGEYTSPIGAVGYVPGGAVLASVITPGQWSSFYC